MDRKFLSDEGSLRVSVSKLKYGGFDGGRGSEGSNVRAGEGLGVDLRELCNEGGGQGLGNDFEKIVGMWNDTNFWRDKWCEDVNLKVKLERLFYLSEQKNDRMCEIGKRCGFGM